MRDPEYRRAAVGAYSEQALALQVRLLRRSRRWSQNRLSEASGLSVRRISAIEHGYPCLSIRDISRLAAAFDVAAIVRLAPFSDLLDSIGTASMPVLSFKQDRGMEGE
jgi:transcriptional regulator with XRE-family HTH domain